MSIFQKKGVVFVTAGLKVWAQTYLGVKFGIKTPSLQVWWFLFCFCFCFVLFCMKRQNVFSDQFYEWCSCVHHNIYVPPPPDCRKRNDFSRPVARIDGGGGGRGAGPQKGGPFWTSPPYPSCKNPILWLKVDLLADLGLHRTPASPDSCYFIFSIIYLFCCFMLLSIRELPIKDSLDFRGESILTHWPPPPCPLYIIFTLSWS